MAETKTARPERMRRPAFTQESLNRKFAEHTAKIQQGKLPLTATLMSNPEPQFHTVPIKNTAPIAGVSKLTQAYAPTECEEKSSQKSSRIGAGGRRKTRKRKTKRKRRKTKKRKTRRRRKRRKTKKRFRNQRGCKR